MLVPAAGGADWTGDWEAQAQPSRAWTWSIHGPGKVTGLGQPGLVWMWMRTCREAEAARLHTGPPASLLQCQCCRPWKAPAPPQVVAPQGPGRFETPLCCAEILGEPQHSSMAAGDWPLTQRLENVLQNGTQTWKAPQSNVRLRELLLVPRTRARRSQQTAGLRAGAAAGCLPGLAPGAGVRESWAMHRDSVFSLLGLLFPVLLLVAVGVAVPWSSRTFCDVREGADRPLTASPPVPAAGV